jgi:hypothetical protein
MRPPTDERRMRFSKRTLLIVNGVKMTLGDAALSAWLHLAWAASISRARLAVA